MLPYLNKFFRNFPAIQTKQLLSRVSQARERGEITDSKQLKEELAKLANVVNEDKLNIRVPFLFLYDGDMLESDAFKTFMENVQLDMDACLGEVEGLGDAIRAHHRILVDHYFNSIDAGITELEKRIKKYELLSRNKNFNDAVNFDFSGSISTVGLTNSPSISLQSLLASKSETGEPPNTASEQEAGVTPDRRADTSELPPNLWTFNSNFTERAGFDLSGLFIDKRGSQELHWSPPVEGESGITLATKQVVSKFQNVQIISKNGTTASDVKNATTDDVDGNNILNLIDGLPDTTWIHSIKTTRVTNNPCKLKLLLSFSGARRINAISINPNSGSQMKLTEVSYLNTGEVETSVSITETLLDPSTKTIIDLGDITAKGVYLTFQQSTGKSIETVSKYSNINGLWRELSGTAILDYASDAQRQTDDPVIGNFIDNTPRTISYTNYEFGFKDIVALSREFEENGLFITEGFITPAINSLSLYANIEYPTEYSDVEFVIRKENFTSDWKFSDVEIFPVLPSGVTQSEERLFMTSKSSETTSSKDVGVLRFYPDLTQSFNVYSSGKLLTLGTDYQISVNSGTTYESALSVVSTPTLPQSCFVKLAAPRTDKIYTVIYSPLVSDQSVGGEIFIDKDKRIILERNETYLFNNSRSEGEIKNCLVVLQMIVRSNSLSNKVTPFIKDVQVLFKVNN